MSANVSSYKCRSSKLFGSYRALGIVTGDLPMVYSPLGRTNFITVSIGKSFQVYNCDKLSLSVVSPQVPKRIRAIDASRGKTYTACGSDIIIWDGIHQVALQEEHDEPVLQVLVIGKVLLSIGEDRKLIVWDLENFESIHCIEFPPSFTPKMLLHPKTYLNKVVVASETGKLQLWNIRTKKMIFEFAGFGSAISCMEQSPVVDVIGIGLTDGRFVTHHLKYNETLVTFRQEEGRVTSIAFRNDGFNIPIAATSTDCGTINLWNMKEKQLHTSIPRAHDSTITSLLFLPNEPLLISSSEDNSIKMWIFDTPDGAGRLLKSRQGHQAPPSRIRYYGNNTLGSMADGADGSSCQILSAGQDRAFRVFHTAMEQLNRELSQGNLLKKSKKLNIPVEKLKLKPIIQFSSMETREKDWNNIVTCHENDPNAYVWSFGNRVIGKQVLTQHPQHKHKHNKRSLDIEGNFSNYFSSGNAVSVALSRCGNFAVVGTTTGAIFKYNIQSGEKRGSFPKAATPQRKLIRALTLKGVNSTIQDTSSTVEDAHKGAVTGLQIDALNRMVISTSLDRTIKVWDFKKHELSYSIDVQSPVSALELHAESQLIAIATEDQLLRIYDISLPDLDPTTNVRPSSNGKLVRRFNKHSHRITDMCFSNDGRWLVSSGGGDCSVRVWDIPSGKCVEWLKFPKPVLSLTMSPTNEFLATTFAGKKGIYLWTNLSLYQNVFMDYEPSEPTEMELPSPIIEDDGGDLVDKQSVADTQQTIESGQRDSSHEDSTKESNIPLDENVITLSTAPPALWQNLFNLELIKQRNKPKNPVQKPAKSPFFLPSVRQEGSEVEPAFQKVSEFATSKSNKQKQKDEGQGEGEDEVDESTLEGWGSPNDDDNDDETSWPTESENTSNDSQSSDTITKNSSRIFKTSGIVSARCTLAKYLTNAPQDDHGFGEGTGNTLQQYETRRFGDACRYLFGLSASAVDVELSSLCMGGDFDEEGVRLLSLFLDLLHDEMKFKCNFQVVQAYMNRFLKLHSDVIVANDALLAKIQTLNALHKQAWEHLQHLLNNNMCLVQYFSKIQL